MNVTATFNPTADKTTNGTDLSPHDGATVTVLRPLSTEKHDTAEVGPMYRIRLPNGEETAAFVDELEPEGHACPGCNGHADPTPWAEEPDCLYCWDTGLPLSHEQYQALVGGAPA